jgi:hypothetical protein
MDDSFQEKGGFVTFIDLNQDDALNDDAILLGCPWKYLKYDVKSQEYPGEEEAPEGCGDWVT